MKLKRLPIMVVLLVPFVSFGAQVEQTNIDNVPVTSAQPSTELQLLTDQAVVDTDIATQVPIVDEELAPTDQEIDETLNEQVQEVVQPEQANQPVEGAATLEPINPQQSNEVVQEPVVAQEPNPAPVEPTKATVQPEIEPIVVQPQTTEEKKIKEEKVDPEVQAKEIKELKESKKKKESQEQKEKKEIEVENVISSLDTLTVEDQGNWLLKRVWWEQAESTFEKIIDVNDQIVRLQGNYFNNRKESDKKITSYLRKLGYEEGQLNESLALLLNQVESDRQLQGDLSVKEREFLELLNEKKKELEQLKIDIETLTNYESSINDVLTQLMTQVDRSRDYEKKAWEDFKEIGRVLNDKRAKVLFYQADANLKNVQNILNFIKNDLNNHLNGLIQKSEQLAESIAISVDSLQKQGINFKEQLENFKKGDAIREQEKRQKEIEKSKEEAKRKKKGWFQSVTDWVKSFF